MVKFRIYSSAEEKRAFMDSLFEGVNLQLGSKGHPDWLFFVKNGQTWMFLKTETGDLWVNYDRIWSHIPTENSEDIREFLRSYMDFKFNLRGIRPHCVSPDRKLHLE